MVNGSPEFRAYSGVAERSVGEDRSGFPIVPGIVALFDDLVGKPAAARRSSTRLRAAPRSRSETWIKAAIGKIPARVVRPLMDGIAVEYRISRDQEMHLVPALKRVLVNYPLDDL